MTPDKFFYLFLVLGIIISFSSALLLPIPDAIRGYFTLPGIVSFFNIIIEAWRDKRTYERQLEILSRQQDNALAVASHMATVIFDHQVNFIEAYFEKVQTAFKELLDTGPHEKAIEYAKQLYHIRMRYSPWLSAQIELGLLPFERALRGIGSGALLTHLELGNLDHKIIVKKMFEEYTKILNLDAPKQEESPEESISRIIEHLREVLGTVKLTNLRDQAIGIATIRSGSSTNKSKNSM